MTIIMTAVLSAFINNTPIVVLMLPILIGVAVKTGSAPSASLMPMGFASILGGMATTIGSSTNLLVVNVAADMGMTRFSMFDFSVPVLIAGSVATALPLADRTKDAAKTITSYESRCVEGIYRTNPAEREQPGRRPDAGGSHRPRR